MSVEILREKLAVLVEANAVVEQTIEDLLDHARAVEHADRSGAEALLEAAELVGQCEQARHGQLIRLLGQVDRIGARRTGLAPWIATHLDASDGRARAIAQAAKKIGTLPQLAQALSSGRVDRKSVV